MSRFYAFVSCTLLVLFTAGCATFRAPAASPSELGELMAERLALAREVARAKHHSGAPVQDPVREVAILASLIQQAVDRGLSPAEAEMFFAAQIEASRQVQTELLARWASGEPLPAGAPADLRTQLRPRLDEVTRRMLDTLVLAHHRGRWADTAARARDALSKGGFSADVTRIATAPLDAWAAREHQKNARERQWRRQLRPQPSTRR